MPWHDGIPNCTATIPQPSRVKVLHVQKVAAIAGSEKHLLTLLPELRRRGCQAEMLVLADGGDQPQEFLRQMRLSRIPVGTESLIADADPTIIARLARKFGRGRYDIVHTHLIHADVYAGLAARLGGIGTVVSTRHNDDAFRRHRLLKPVLRQSARFAHHFICISEWVREFSRIHEGIPSNRSTTIHYGLRPTLKATERDLRKDLSISPAAPILAAVSRLVPQKGHSTLLRSFREVLTTFPEAQLVLVGDGELKEEVQRLIAELDLNRNTHLLGYQANACQMMREFDVLVHPSKWEGFGLVLLEAMAAALPIVATRVSAIPEIVRDETTGLLVPPDDPHQLAEAIRRCLSDPDWAKRLGRAGARRLKSNFSVSAMARKTLLVYEELLERRNGRRKRRG